LLPGRHATSGVAGDEKKTGARVDGAGVHYALVNAQPTRTVLESAQNHHRRRNRLRLDLAFMRTTSSSGIGRHLMPSGFHIGFEPEHRPHSPFAPDVIQRPEK
jgi:hypothetical protein